MLLQEYLRLVLLEGRLEDLKSKYPNIDIDKLWNGDPSKTKKYVSWTAKNLSNDSQIDELLGLIAVFDKQNSKFKVKDINWYKSIADLKSAVDAVLDSGPSKTQLRKESSSGAVKISEDDAWVVFRIDTKQAAQKLGRDAKWCITMPDKNYYEQYVSDGVKFYYFISKISEARTPNSKIAVAVYENSFEIFDAEDQPIRYGFSKIVGQNLIDDVKEDAPKAPAHIIYQVRKTIDNNGVLQPTVLQKYFDSGATDFEKAVAIQYAPNLKDKLALAAGNKFLTNIIEFYDYNKISDGPFFTLLDTDLDKELPSIIGLDYEEWRHNNVRHRDGDLPALTNQWGDKWWYKNGELHRDGGPAVVRGNIEEWYQHGKLHRDDGGPAVEIKNGTKYWYQHGKLHRDDGPAVITLFPKTESWYQNGLLHRDGGPAMTTETEKAWYQHGKLHRDDGPAVEYSDGKKVYYKHGEIVAPPGDQQ